MVNLVDDVVEVFRAPSPGGYQEHRRMQPGETIRPVALPDLSIDIAELIP